MGIEMHMLIYNRTLKRTFSVCLNTTTIEIHSEIISNISFIKQRNAICFTQLYPFSVPKRKIKTRNQRLI